MTSTDGVTPLSTTPVPERPRARADVVFRPLGEEWVLYDPVTRQLHVLNVAAALVWTLCDGEHDRADMADSLAGTLAGVPDPASVLDDVATVLGSLHGEGLLL